MALTPKDVGNAGRKVTEIRMQNHAFPNDYRDAISNFMRLFVTKVLKSTNGNISQAARQMNIARRNLQLKVKALDMDVDALRGDSI